MGGGIASAAPQSPTVAKSSKPVVMVDPREDVQSMCTVYHDKYACATLMGRNKMTKMVQNCLVKAGIGGAAAFVVGRYISKDAAEHIAGKVVVAGAAGCLSSFT